MLYTIVSVRDGKGLVQVFTHRENWEKGLLINDDNVSLFCSEPLFEIARSFSVVREIVFPFRLAIYCRA